jgi:hypothetical protein
MFLIMGVSQKEQKLNFDQLIICKCCGKYGHIEVFVTYSYFMLFFIPIIKWNRNYYVRMNCCGTTCELDPELGRAIEKGDVTSLDIGMLNFEETESELKHCSYCGFKTTEDFQFCPKCGKNM